jgi:hypothetical protein
MLDGEGVLRSIATRLAGIVKTGAPTLQSLSFEPAASGIERIARHGVPAASWSVCSAPIRSGSGHPDLVSALGLTRLPQSQQRVLDPAPGGIVAAAVGDRTRIIRAVTARRASLTQIHP